MTNMARSFMYLRVSLLMDNGRCSGPFYVFELVGGCLCTETSRKDCHAGMMPIGQACHYQQGHDLVHTELRVCF